MNRLTLSIFQFESQPLLPVRIDKQLYISIVNIADINRLVFIFCLFLIYICSLVLFSVQCQSSIICCVQCHSSCLALFPVYFGFGSVIIFYNNSLDLFSSTLNLVFKLTTIIIIIIFQIMSITILKY